MAFIDEIEKIIMEDVIKDLFNHHYYLEFHLSTLRQDPDRFRLYFLNKVDAAYIFARKVDMAPRDDTRKVACRFAYFAYRYALDVDKCYHDETYKGVQSSHQMTRSYTEAFGLVVSLGR